jgi:hypothetical protein
MLILDLEFQSRNIDVLHLALEIFMPFISLDEQDNKYALKSFTYAYDSV